MLLGVSGKCRHSGGEEGELPREAQEEPWRAHRGHGLPVSLTCVGPQATPLSGPHSSICNPRGLHKMVHFTAFTEHLRVLGPSPAPRAHTCVGKTDIKGLLRKAQGRREWQEAGPPWGPG